MSIADFFPYNISIYAKLALVWLNVIVAFDISVGCGCSGFVTVTVKGDKTVEKVTINNDDISSDDKEMIEDMLVVALNDAFKQIDKVTEEKMGKFNSMMPGMF